MVYLNSNYYLLIPYPEIAPINRVVNVSVIDQASPVFLVIGDPTMY
jgi:hypothetical protein